MGKPHTIIGAEQFHFRVRDGIGWFLLAMAARQNLLTLSVAFRVLVVQFGKLRVIMIDHADHECVVTQHTWVLYGQAARAISTR